ncbi:dimer_Tnp_hAT domain-containing protein [Trichonephila clavipes]|nr:dimer_Tnp_hAT domain-containing protein [Trichonephila clavipes]
MKFSTQDSKYSEIFMKRRKRSQNRRNTWLKATPKTPMKNNLCKSVDISKCIRRWKKITTREIFYYIRKNKVESTFPNLEVAMRIYLTLPVTNSTAERNFSAFKITTVKNEKLKSLMFLRTQNDITMEIDCNNIINDFAMMRKLEEILCCISTMTVTQLSRCLKEKIVR